jgi:hypothetical protein
VQRPSGGAVAPPGDALLHPPRHGDELDAATIAEAPGA